MPLYHFFCPDLLLILPRLQQHIRVSPKIAPHLSCCQYLLDLPWSQLPGESMHTVLQHVDKPGLIVVQNFRHRGACRYMHGVAARKQSVAQTFTCRVWEETGQINHSQGCGPIRMSQSRSDVPAPFMHIKAQAKPKSYRVLYSGDIRLIQTQKHETSRISRGSQFNGNISEQCERESRGFEFQYCTLVLHASGLVSRSILPVTIHFQQACALYPISNTRIHPHLSYYCILGAQ